MTDRPAISELQEELIDDFALFDEVRKIAEVVGSLGFRISGAHQPPELWVTRFVPARALDLLSISAPLGDCAR